MAPRRRSWLGWAALLGATAWLVAGCTAQPPVLYVSGLNLDAVDVSVTDEGVLNRREQEERAAEQGADAVLRIDDPACAVERCPFQTVSIYIKNTGPEPLPPPVVRIEVPRGRPARKPVAFGAQAIGPGRTGRIRWLIQRYPDEGPLRLHLSASVFLTFEPAGPSPSP